jgi:DnaJ-class molecular chaperone
MKRTAYDPLGVSPTAGKEEIAATYLRQQATPDPALPENHGNPDADFRLKPLQEAFSLVNEPVRRAAYDASLRTQTVAYYPDPDPRSVKMGRSKMRLVGIAFLATVAAGLTYLYQNKKQEFAQERERVLAAAQEAERRRAEGGDHDEEAWRQQQQQQEQRVRDEMEAAHREGEDIGQQLRADAEAARQNAEWERQRQEEARMEQRYNEEEAAARRYETRQEPEPQESERGGTVAVVPHPSRPTVDSGGR